MKKDNFFQTLGATLYKEHITTGRGATVFLGAGCSIDSMVMSWPAIAEDICDRFGIDKTGEEGAIGALHKKIAEGITPDERYSWIASYLINKTPSLGHQHLTQLASLGYISTIVTTNWDCLIEECLSRQISSDRMKVYVRGLTPDSKIAQALTRSIEHKDVVNVVKLHGDIHSRDFMVTDDEIDNIENSLQSVLTHLFSRLTYIIGSSVNDINILKLFMNAAKLGPRYHLVYGVNKSDNISGILAKCGVRIEDGKKDVVTLNYDRVDVGNFSHFFSQLNISVQKQILLDSYDELEEIKKEILSKEEVGLRYINTKQIEDQIEHFGFSVKSQRPDLVVFINDPKAPGGMEIKRRLKPILAQNKIISVDLEVSGSRGSRVYERSAKWKAALSEEDATKIRKILILDAITFSGNTIKIAKSQIQSLYPDAVVKCGVLVISKMLQEKKDGPGIDFFNAITDRFEIHFPWGVTQTTGRFQRRLGGIHNSRCVEIDKRAWGALEVLANDEFCSVRHLSLEAGTKLSFQRHFCRDELYVALDDHIGLKIAVNMEEEVDSFDEFSPKIHSITLEKGDYVLIPRGVWHRPEAYMNRVRILEISFGVYDQVSDIERFADDYSREIKDGEK